LLVTGAVGFAVLPQNFANPEDTNSDGYVSPGDALRVINELNSANTSASPTSFSPDVDGDGIVTPRDALLVINRLNTRGETSGVPPQQRAIGLRKALDAGIVPPRMSLSDAEEMLEMLENGGHYEAGERYRNGQMLNISQQPQDLSDAVAGAESEDASTALEPVGTTIENLEPVATSLKTVEENDPLALLESADETLYDPLHDPTIWQAFVDARIAGDAQVVDRLATQLSEQLTQRLASTDAREQMAQAIAEAFQSGEHTAQYICDEIAALRATLGDAHSQVAQLFANVDIEGIIEQMRVDLGTLAEVVVSDDHLASTDREAIFSEFLSRAYLHGSFESLP